MQFEAVRAKMHHQINKHSAASYISSFSYQSVFLKMQQENGKVYFPVFFCSQRQFRYWIGETRNGLKIFESSRKQII